ncbi:MAG: hypothetical protein BGO63_00040 [Candidatus Accumulibacter sp. 66-26]|nr:membrane protein insertion efficiency factor YidD [Accumulibacter sp.]OJW47597.1 MAG: hypothetical protein BGO63_00040 [Candidatus Accumulibacter sp. 66-26]
MRTLVLAAITAYQRHLSPRKGFCCAYRVHTGRHSCSVLGFRAIRRYGVFAGFAVLQRRLHLCGVAHRRYSPPRRRPHRAQRGDCDFGCDLPCDLDCNIPNGKTCSALGDFLTCCDCAGCDGPERKRKKTDREQYVHIPPRTGRTEGSRR